MDDYIDLSVQAKGAGGPAELVEKLTREGFNKGMVVTALVSLALYGAKDGVTYLVKRHKSQKAEEFAAAAADAIAKAEGRSPNKVHTKHEVQRDLTLTIGDEFTALTRDGDVIMIKVESRSDNPFFVSGAQLQQISDFKLDEIDDL
jgi:hypothetical protein